MSQWISKAANVFKRETVEAPLPFEIACECGQSHTGIRRARHQHIVCKACGGSLFVLPKDSYPQPVEKPRKAKKRKKEQPVYDDVEVVDSPIRSRRKKKKKNKAEAKPQPSAFANLSNWLSSRLTYLVQSFLGLWTPFRMIFLAIVVIGGVTLYWSILEYQRTQAASYLAAYVEAGKAAVEDQAWIEARQQFSLAVEALDQLGRTDNEAQSIRQLQRETHAMTRLSDKTLFELLDEIDKTFPDLTPEQRDIEITVLRDKWFVLTAPIRKKQIQTEDGEMVDTFEIVFPWSPNPQRPVTILFAPLEMKSWVPPDRKVSLTIAGTFSDVRLNSITNEWTLELDPAKSFLWANPETYVGLGFGGESFETPEERDARLANQAAMLGMTPE